VVDVLGVNAPRGAVHGFAPRPEIIAIAAAILGPPADQPLESMRVCVCESRQESLARKPNDLGIGILFAGAYPFNSPVIPNQDTALRHKAGLEENHIR
jgi:hypothetical protein